MAVDEPMLESAIDEVDEGSVDDPAAAAASGAFCSEFASEVNVAADGVAGEDRNETDRLVGCERAGTEAEVEDDDDIVWTCERGRNRFIAAIADYLRRSRICNFRDEHARVHRIALHALRCVVTFVRTL